MKTESDGAPATGERTASAHRREWRAFLLLAGIGLPLAMVIGIATYGFVVWFLQILVFGPPA